MAEFQNADTQKRIDESVSLRQLIDVKKRLVRPLPSYTMKAGEISLANTHNTHRKRARRAVKRPNFLVNLKKLGYP